MISTYGFPRSGNMLLRAYMKQAFGVENSFLGHKLFDNKFPAPRIYIYRDGRDSILSMVTTASRVRRKHKAVISLEHLLSTPMPGRKPDLFIDFTSFGALVAQPGLTLPQIWMNHLESWKAADDTLFVRYEELVGKTEETLIAIAEFIKQPIVNSNRIAWGVGLAPSGDFGVNKWKAVYTDGELAMFHKYVPENYWGLYMEK